MFEKLRTAYRVLAAAYGVARALARIQLRREQANAMGLRHTDNEPCERCLFEHLEMEPGRKYTITWSPVLTTRDLSELGRRYTGPKADA